MSGSDAALKTEARAECDAVRLVYWFARMRFPAAKALRVETAG